MTWVPSASGGADPQPLRHSLDRFARKVGVPTSVSLGVVFSHWEELVGPSVAAHAQPTSLVKGTLVVTVEEPGWATQLRYLSADILQRLEEVAGPGVATRFEVRVRGANRRS